MKNRKKPAGARQGVNERCCMNTLSAQCTFSRSAEPVTAAGIWGQLARLDHQNARVHKDEGQMR
eukprot:3287942-Prymnesium_polylepis.1